MAAQVFTCVFLLSVYSLRNFSLLGLKNQVRQLNFILYYDKINTEYILFTVYMNIKNVVQIYSERYEVKMNEEIKKVGISKETGLPEGSSADSEQLARMASELLERYSETFRELAK